MTHEGTCDDVSCQQCYGRYPELWSLKDKNGFIRDGGYYIAWTDKEQSYEDILVWRRITGRKQLCQARIK